MIILTKITSITIGSLLIGTGINGFLVPHHLLDGGMVGIALILHYQYGFQVSLCMILVSLPLFIYTWFQDRKLVYSSFQGLLACSFCINWLSPLQNNFPLPVFVSSIIGGGIIGVGIGLMLRYETSTGGTELLAYFISKASTINIGLIIFLLDGLIAMAGYNSLGLKSFLFSVLTIFTVGFISSIFIKNHSRGLTLYWRGYLFYQ